MSNTEMRVSAPELPTILVNGTAISQESLALELQYHPAANVEEAVNKAAQALIIQELFVQEALAQGLDKKVTPAESESRSEALIRALIEQKIAEPAIDDLSCRRYFELNPERFCSPDLIEASHILFAADPNDPVARDAAQEKAQSLLALLLQQPEKLAELAQQYSDCPSKETGGNLGQLSKGQTTPEFERQVFMLEVGMAAKPIESRYGYHLVRVDRKILGDPLPYEQVKEKIELYLKEQGSRNAVRQYIHELMESATIEGVDIEEINPTLTH